MFYQTNTRRQFLKLLGLGTASVLLGDLVHCHRSQRLPNVVFILADDLGYHQIGCYGNHFYETPNVDHLATQGMRFTDAYAACPVCSPTRASIMTGKYPARLHLTDFIPGNTWPFTKLLTPEWTQYLPLEEVTIPEALKPAGYVTGHFGKWHLNRDKNYQPGRPMDPASQGFDDVLTTVKPKPDADPTTDPHHVTQITGRALNFIETYHDQPFFCYVTHHTIHNPVMERPELIAQYQAKSEAENPKNNPVVAAMVETLDTEVGRILQKLDELNLTDQTMVIFFSDNGAIRAQADLKPLRGGKAQLYEGGIRVPLIVRWPGTILPGTSCQEPVSSIDFFPTLVEAAGLTLDSNEIDGVSLWPLLIQSGSFAREAIFWHYPHYHTAGIAPSGAIRQGKYKLIEWFERSIDGIDTEGALELFDLETDPSEQHNLIKTVPDLGYKLYHQLKDWRMKVGAEEMMRNPDYDPNNDML